MPPGLTNCALRVCEWRAASPQCRNLGEGGSGLGFRGLGFRVWNSAHLPGIECI